MRMRGIGGGKSDGLDRPSPEGMLRVHGHLLYHYSIQSLGIFGNGHCRA